MKNKKGKDMCILLSAALLMATLPPVAAGAADVSTPAPQVETADTENPAATATATATAEATTEPTAEPSASAVPEPTATVPADTTMEMDISANIFADEDDKSVYEVQFSTEKTMPEITAFDITVSFTEAKVNTADFTKDLEEKGTTNVLRGDRKAIFQFSEAKETISGKTLIGSVFVKVDDNKKLSSQNIKVDSFTATTKEGGKLIITPTVIATVGPAIPDLEKNEQAVVDLIKALPQKSTLSFFADKEKGEFINLKDLKERAQEAQTKYKALTAASKTKVEKVLAAEELSSDVIGELVALVPKLEKTIGMVQIGYGIKDITAETALDYAFYLDVFKDLTFNASDLLGATTALDEFNSALTAINQAQTLYEEALKDADYSEKTDGIVNQYENLKKAGTHTYYKKYSSSLSESAADLRDEITKKYSGSDKNTLLRLIKSVIDSINQDQQIAKDLPTVKLSPIYYGGGWTVTLTRDNTYPDYEDGSITVTVYNKNNTKMDTGTAVFKSSSKTGRVAMTAKKGTYGTNQRIYVYVSYELNGTTYDLGSQTATVLVRQSSTTTSGNNNTYNPSRPGNVEFPSNTTNPLPTRNPNSDDALFTDLSGYDWAEEAIEGLYYAGIVNGMEEGIFNPAGLVTREQFAKMVVQLFGVSTGAAATGFKDVKVSEWYAPYISAAVAAGYVQGQSDEYFGIGEQIMRQDMATILYRAMGRDQDKKPITFTDADQIAPYAYDAISELVGLGAINGYEDGSFKPRGTATRAEAAKVIWSVYNALNK